MTFVSTQKPIDKDNEQIKERIIVKKEGKREIRKKLEFLGDSILEFISSKYLYTNYPKLNEGELTKTRATVACEASLYEVAKRLDFSEFLITGKGERSSGEDSGNPDYQHDASGERGEGIRVRHCGRDAQAL